MRTLTVVGTGSKGNCYILDCDGEKLILDAGVRIHEIKTALKWNIKGVRYALVSHGHMDHRRSEIDLGIWGIPVLAPYHCDIMLKSVKCGNFFVYSFELPHNGVKNYGFYIQHKDWNMVYMTDFEYCKYTFSKYHLNAMLIECNHTQTNLEASNYTHVVLGHASLDVTKEFVRVNATEDLSNVVLCHLSDVNADPDLIKAEISSVVPPMTKVDIAEKGMIIEL